MSDGGNVSGALTATLTITNLQGTDAGNYDVVVTNAVGSITSMVASLTVLVPPSIAAQPISLTVTQGSAASFTVTAAGDAPLFYQLLIGEMRLACHAGMSADNSVTVSPIARLKATAHSGTLSAVL